MSRKPSDLSPKMQSKYIAWDQKMKDAGIDYILTCTRRTSAEQQALWDQGRKTPGPIVTWTLISRHLTGDAWDFVIMNHGKPDWKMVLHDQWIKAVEFGKELGLEQVVGSDGRVKEFAHLQNAEG